MASADHFLEQLAVLDAASAVFLRMLGEAERRARTAFAVPRLPLDTPVELVVTFAVTGRCAAQPFSGGAREKTDAP